MEELRWEVFRRSGGMCEERILTDDGPLLRRCGAPITWDTMELSHLRHGANKTDTAEGTIASCKECHRNRHNAGRHPCPKRPGRVMNLKEAQAYWLGEICFCDQPKKARESFCADCNLKLAPQTRHDLENADDPDVYRQTLADAEIEILKRGAA